MKTPVFKPVPAERGVTLIETMIVLAIIGVLAALAAPSFQRQMEAQRVEGAAEALVAALQDAKSKAVMTSQDVYLVITGGAICLAPNCSVQANATNNWCFGIAPPGVAACDCTAANSCETGTVVNSTDYSGVGITFNTATSRRFRPIRGTATSGTIRFFAGNNQSLGVTTTTIGRIRICKDNASTLISYSDSGVCP